MGEGIFVKTDKDYEWRSGDIREGRGQSIRWFVLGSGLQYSTLDFDIWMDKDVAEGDGVKGNL